MFPNKESYSNKPILVTGGARSGTTWVGRMIAKSPLIRYVHEPFNISGPSCSCGVKFDYWYYYISKDNGANFYEHIKHNLSPHANKYELLNVMGTKRLRSLLNSASSYLTVRTVMKDPLALFSAEWLVEAFDMDVIILIRHPAAFVNSYLRLNWSHPYSHFTRQPLLVRDLLYPYEAEIQNYAINEHDIIDQASLLWKLLHHVIREYQQVHGDWIFIRHEDLLQDPVSRFQKIYDQLGLKFSARIRRSIEENSSSRGAVDPENPYSIQRNSSQVLWNWKKALQPADIERIRKQVEDVSCEFYSDEDW